MRSAARLKDVMRQSRSTVKTPSATQRRTVSKNWASSTVSGGGHHLRSTMPGWPGGMLGRAGCNLWLKLQQTARGAEGPVPRPRVQRGSAAPLHRGAPSGYFVHKHTTGASLPRPRKRRACRAFDGDPVFKPRSIPMTELDVVELRLSELEALRLCDLEGLDQEAAGARMGVSRGTVQRLLKERPGQGGGLPRRQPGAASYAKERRCASAFPRTTDQGLWTRRSIGHFGSAPVLQHSRTRRPGEVEVVPNANRRHEHGQCNPVGALMGIPRTPWSSGAWGATPWRRLTEAGIGLSDRAPHGAAAPADVRSGRHGRPSTPSAASRAPDATGHGHHHHHHHA